MFSATFPASIQALANDLLHEPERIDVQAESLPAPAIRQRAIEVDPGQRTQLLRHLLQEEGWSRALVFVASRHAAEVVAAKLCKAGIRAEALHGDLSQGRRTRVLQEFKQEQVQVLVATDVASRGIDIAELPVVVNYDLPRSTTDYTHRIGRTGRAGQSGMAISFISADTAAHFRLIEKRERLRVPRERIAGFEPVEVLAANPADPAATGGIKGARPSRKDKLRAAAALEKAKDHARVRSDASREWKHGKPFATHVAPTRSCVTSRTDSLLPGLLAQACPTHRAAALSRCDGRACSPLRHRTARRHRPPAHRWS